MEPILELTVTITATPNVVRGTLDMQVRANLGGLPEFEDAFEDITALATPQFTQIGEQVGRILTEHVGGLR